MTSAEGPTTPPVHIDAPLVQRLIASQFPEWRQLHVRPVKVDGWDNRTFRLGDDKSVRLPSAEGYKGQVEKEQEWLPRLASRLPLPIPALEAMGVPGQGFPWNWAVNKWLVGDSLTPDSIDDLESCAKTLAAFVSALERVDARNGPAAGGHNFHRGGPLVTYDAQTRSAIAILRDVVDARSANALWNAALETNWDAGGVWIHGDLNASNLIASGGRLSAVIDFGLLGVGDPACDLTIAWTLFSGASRAAFRASLSFTDATWARARGWALWKALITIVGQDDADSTTVRRSQRVIAELIADSRAPA